MRNTAANLLRVFDVLVVRCYLFVTDGCTQRDFDSDFPNSGTVSGLAGMLFFYPLIAYFLWMTWQLPTPEPSKESTSVLTHPAFWLLLAYQFLVHHGISRAIKARGGLGAILTRIENEDKLKLKERFPHSSNFLLFLGWPFLGMMIFIVRVVQQANG